MGYNDRWKKDFIIIIDDDNEGIYTCPIDGTELVGDKCPECGFDNTMWGANDRTKIWVTKVEKDDEEV